jgi:hypothetical protein
MKDTAGPASDTCQEEKGAAATMFTAGAGLGSDREVAFVADTAKTQIFLCPTRDFGFIRAPASQIVIIFNHNQVALHRGFIQASYTKHAYSPLHHRLISPVKALTSYRTPS